jgi:GTP-binding protein Era
MGRDDHAAIGYIAGMATSALHLETLNSAQRKAVTTGQSLPEQGFASGPLLIIAGAGTGKTSTLAHRVAHLILNKVDLVDKAVLLKFAADINEIVKFDETFMISALKGSGVEDLLKGFARLVAKGPWLYPEDQVSDAPLRLLAAEITREKIFERLHDELPYQMTVETDQWKEQKDGSARVEQTIFVTRDSHKKIVIGDEGKMLKSIGMSARKDIMEAADCKVHLFLFVKVRENWIDDPERYREMGLDFPRD